MAIEITLQDLRRFILLKQGLLGDYRFSGKDGALAYIRQAGCIQFDPIDICGRNAELTLQSRVKSVRRQDLYDLLYKEHALVDYTDKELSILPVEDWPYFARWRGTAKRNAAEFDGIAELSEKALEYIREHGAVSADELPISGTIRWNSAIHWSGNWHGESKAARSILEQLYSEGRLIIHHKSGTRKYYDLAERAISEELLAAEDPTPELIDHIKWGILRRIGAIGTLWNRRSDSLLGIWGMDAALRRQAFQELELEGRILPIEISENKSTFYILTDDRPLLEEASLGTQLKKRCELIAPLDPMLWDRNQIEEVFSFRYRWEIYVPADKRQFGYYVLPTLYGDRFIGRVEAVADRQNRVLTVRHVWFEQNVRRTKAMDRAIHGALKRLAHFNDCRALVFSEQDLLT